MLQDGWMDAILMTLDKQWAEKSVSTLLVTNVSWKNPSKSPTVMAFTYMNYQKHHIVMPDIVLNKYNGCHEMKYLVNLYAPSK